MLFWAIAVRLSAVYVTLDNDAAMGNKIVDIDAESNLGKSTRRTDASCKSCNVRKVKLDFFPVSGVIQGFLFERGANPSTRDRQNMCTLEFIDKEMNPVRSDGRNFQVGAIGKRFSSKGLRVEKGWGITWEGCEIKATDEKAYAELRESAVPGKEYYDVSGLEFAMKIEVRPESPQFQTKLIDINAVVAIQRPAASQGVSKYEVKLDCVTNSFGSGIRDYSNSHSEHLTGRFVPGPVTVVPLGVKGSDYCNVSVLVENSQKYRAQTIDTNVPVLKKQGCHMITEKCCWDGTNDWSAVCVKKSFASKTCTALGLQGASGNVCYH